jgi:hypothetical protein
LDSTTYHNLLSRILGSLQRDPLVVGMIALGSTADPTLRDKWSDHDFWIITQPGREDYYLDSADWLPDSKQILISVRHGAHYRAALYRDGHKVEYGVFESGTAYQGKIERYSVLLERGGMVSLASGVREEARTIRREQVFRPTNLANLAILVWTAYERHGRGEWLAGERYLSFAIDLFLDLMTAYVLPEEEKRADFLDPRRRLEQRRPQLASELREILATADAASGARLLRIAERELREEAAELEWDAIETVRKLIEERAAS